MATMSYTKCGGSRLEKIEIMTFGHELWDKTIVFVEKCA